MLSLIHALHDMPPKLDWEGCRARCAAYSSVREVAYDGGSCTRNKELAGVVNSDVVIDLEDRPWAIGLFEELAMCQRGGELRRKSDVPIGSRGLCV